MALVVFLQEHKDVPRLNRNLKIFCETAPCCLHPPIHTGFIQKTRPKNQGLFKDFQAPNYYFFQDYSIFIDSNF